jgi:hypothetical protein
VQIERENAGGAVVKVAKPKEFSINASDDFARVQAKKNK